MQATYVSSNQLKVSEDKTEEFLAGRRIRALCGSDYKYSTILSSIYSSPYTTITIEESILTSNLSFVHYGIVNIGEQGSFPNHSHDGNEGTGGEISLLTLSDAPNSYEEGEYLRSTISGVEWTVPEAEAIVVRVKEENVSAITKGQVCAIVGSSGVLTEIGLCDCEDPDKIRIVGIAQADIVQNEGGIVVYKGIITGVDTSITNTDVNPNGETWLPKDLLWVSNTLGGMTNVRPASGRGIKAARTVKGNSNSDILIVISHENTIWSTAAAGENVVLRVGDSAGANKVSIREYTNSEVAAFDSYGNLTVSGTVDGVDVAVLKSDFDLHDHDDLYYTKSEVDTISGTLQTNINTKSDTELFLTDGVPSDSIGKENDIAIDQDIGTVYKKVQDDVITTFYPAVSGDDVVVKENGSFYSSIRLVVGEQNGNISWSSSVRFPNVTIPNGVTITSVYIKFTAHNNQAGTVCNANCYFNDVDNAVAPINASEYNALVVTSPIAWNDVSAWTDGTQYDTPELKTILQPVIDRAGWASGQAMQFLIKDNGSDTNARREMSSIDLVSGTEKPELHVTWSENVWGEKLSPDFLKLSDTPTTYSGSDGKYLKTTTSGIEFSDDDLYTKSEVDTISGTLQTNIDAKPDTFLELEDTPTTYSGSDWTYVKPTNSGIEFSDDYHFGDDTNYTKIEIDGKIHFFGDAQPVNFTVIDSLNCDASHLAPLSLISLASTNGIQTSGLDTSEGELRRIEVIGVDGGVYVKGRKKVAYSQGDTTHESYRIKIRLNTTNTTWEQAGEWKIILDILSGDITGGFTIYMPAFSIMEYSTLEVYVTVNGATYSEITSRGFDVSVAGPVAEEELFSNNETTGSGVVVEVASTAGFYVGNEVFVSDTSNSEWTRIEEIITDTSMTVDLINSYTTVSGAKFNAFDYVRTTLTEPIQRGLFRAKVFKASENSGVQFQMPVPQQTDPTKDMGVVLQYISTTDNPGLTMVSKWRVQYFFKTIGEDIPESYQYAELVYADITPPATKCNYIGTLATLTPEDHQGKNLLAMEVVRLGADSGDTYTGNFKLAAIITTMPWKQLGYEA